jgi:hypothetical protein
VRNREIERNTTNLSSGFTTCPADAAHIDQRPASSANRNQRPRKEQNLFSYLQPPPSILFLGSYLWPKTGWLAAFVYPRGFFPSPYCTAGTRCLHDIGNAKGKNASFRN